MADPGHLLQERANRGGNAMGNLGRITGLGVLPPDDVLEEFIRQAMKLNDEGVKAPKRKKPESALNLKIPADFAALLAKDKKARISFDAFPPSHRREYVQWIEEAKRPETRARRIATTLEWLAEGKSRNWKYEK